MKACLNYMIWTVWFITRPITLWLQRFSFNVIIPQMNVTYYLKKNDSTCSIQTNFMKKYTYTYCQAKTIFSIFIYSRYENVHTLDRNAKYNVLLKSRMICVLQIFIIFIIFFFFLKIIWIDTKPQIHPKFWNSSINQIDRKCQLPLSNKTRNHGFTEKSEKLYDFLTIIFIFVKIYYS